MRQASKRIPESAEKTVRDIRRATRRHHSAEEKIRIVLEGLRGENSEARDEDRRCRLLEVARFYRSLAQIIPVMPNGYKNNKDGGLAVTRAQRWHCRAEECRTLADCFTDPTCRGQLTRLAQDYDRMADAAE